jgi:serine/threonine protein kinase
MPPPTVSGHADVDWLIGTLTRAKVLDADRARTALSEFRVEQPHGDTDDAIRFFIREGILTLYQAERAYAGEADKLQLGPYLLLEPLGQGNLGVVYRAIHRGTREYFAIKTLPLRSLWKVIEAKKLADRISDLPPHAALIPFADVNTAAGSHYLAWPFVTGETLESIVRKFGPLAAVDAARIMAEVADGLAVCHAAGVIHGLLKPSNLMLGTDRHPRILDLGVGAILADNIDDESMIDTISTASAAMDMMDFAPPETIADPTTRTPEADMYSFGCVLYYLITGVPPFAEGNVVDKMMAHQTKVPKSISALNPAVSGTLSDFVDRLLVKIPDKRPTAAQVRDELRALQTQLRDTSTTSNRLSMAMGKIAAALAAAKWDGDYQSSGNISLPHSPRRPARRFDDNDNEGAIDFDETISDTFGNGPETPVRSSVSKAREEIAAESKQPLPSMIAPQKIAPEPSSSATARTRKTFDLPKPIGHENQASAAFATTVLPEVVIPPVPQFQNSKLSKFAVWKARVYAVQISIFGPQIIDPGQRVTFTIYAHLPESFANAKTLCRAMRSDAELVGVGYLELPIPHGTDLMLTMALSNAGLAKSDAKIHWVGQLQPRTYDVFVPWECPAGLMSGVVTASIEKKMAGSIPMQCLIRPRSS